MTLSPLECLSLPSRVSPSRVSVISSCYVGIWHWVSYPQIWHSYSHIARDIARGIAFCNFAFCNCFLQLLCGNEPLAMWDSHIARARFPRSTYTWPLAMWHIHMTSCYVEFPHSKIARARFPHSNSFLHSNCKRPLLLCGNEKRKRNRKKERVWVFHNK